MSVSIRRKAGRLSTQLLLRRSAGTLRLEEWNLVDGFESASSTVLDEYARGMPREPRTTDALVFQHLYDAAFALPGAEQWPDDGEPFDEDTDLRTVLAALLAAETEARGPLRLTTAQSIRLAEVVERLGHELRRRRLPLHASLAFTRAGTLFLEAEQWHARDRCMLAGLRSRHAARGFGGAKALESVSDALCGYGYAPYRLLGWGALQLAVFSVVLVLGFHAGLANGVYTAMENYLNPVGTGEAKLPDAARIPLVVESYAGLISTSVFFALIVRRWFRL
jgi:hypothetical protein